MRDLFIEVNRELAREALEDYVAVSLHQEVALPRTAVAAIDIRAAI